jgi:hypothetical protein
MANGDCPVGSSNSARITVLERRTDRLEVKIDWIFYVSISTLVGVVINFFT